MFTLKRDGYTVCKGTMIELLQFIHRKHCYSLSWACQWEGYSVHETDSGKAVAV